MIENRDELVQSCKTIKEIVNEELAKVPSRDADQIEYLTLIKEAIELFVEYGIDHNDNKLVDEGLIMVDNLIRVFPEEYGLCENRKIFGCDYV
jgi:hypothetical protein